MEPELTLWTEVQTSKAEINLDEVRMGRPERALDVSVGRGVRHELNLVVGIVPDTAVGPCSRLVVQAVRAQLIPQFLGYRRGMRLGWP
jgi:hypothetical protein